MFIRTIIIASVATLTLNSYAGDPKSRQTIATSTLGVVTAADLRLHSTLSDSPYPDPLASYCSAKIASDKLDAEEFVTSGIAEILWERKSASDALAAGYKLSREDEASVRRSVDSCLIEQFEQQTRESYFTSSPTALRAHLQHAPEAPNGLESREVEYIFRSTTGPLGLKSKSSLFRELQKLRADILAGNLSFDQAALRYSEAPSASNGGRLGLIRSDIAMNPDVRRFFFSIAENQISDVTEVHNGFYIARVTRVVPAIAAGSGQQESTDVLRELIVQQTLRDIAVTTDSLDSTRTTQRNRAALISGLKQRQFKSDDCEDFEKLLYNRLLAIQFLHRQNAASIKPSETEIQDYYKLHPDEMKEEGIWKFTKFAFPVGAEREFKTRELALAAATALRNQLISGMTKDESTSTTAGLVPESVRSWTVSTGDGPSDRSLLTRKPGEYSDISFTPEGVVFYRLDATRALPLAPLESKRAYITKLLWHLKSIALMQSAVAQTATTLKLNHLWRDRACCN